MSKKIKLGLDIRTMSVKGSGIGRVEIEITRRLIEKLEEDKWEIHLFPGKETVINFKMKNNVIVHENLRKHNSTLKRSIWFSPYYSIKNRLNLFHSLDFLGPSWKKGFKLIQTIHDIIPLIFYKEASYKSLFMCKYIMPLMFKSADYILTFSQNTKNDLLENYKIKDDKIKVIPLAGRDEFKMEVSQDEIEEVKKKYNINKKYFIFTGTLEPKKNVIRIGKAFINIKKKYDDICLVFAGTKGWQVDELYEIAKDEKDIIFTGFVPDEDLVPLVKGAFCFLFPSIYEGFGLPVLDAFNAEIPLITSNTSSIPEIAGEAAILIDPLSIEELENAMKIILENNEKRRELIEKGKRQAEKFSWDKTVVEIIKLYKELIF